jgi:hypothetical protein
MCFSHTHTHTHIHSFIHSSPSPSLSHICPRSTSTPFLPCSPFQTNAATTGDQRLGEFLHLASLLIPLYSPRAAELAFFGKDGVSLATSASLGDCFQIA